MIAYSGFLGGAVSMMQSNAAPFVLIIEVTVTVEENDKTTPHAIQDPDLLTWPVRRRTFPPIPVLYLLRRSVSRTAFLT